MKKFYLIAALTVATLTANAQQKLYLSTYNGTNLEHVDGKTCLVSANRYMFKGWNTIALPFAMTTDELNEMFGTDCRLERLIGVENDGNDILLNFQDCKAEGLQANTPYVLYYTGENANKKIEKEALISNGQASISFLTNRGEQVTMAGVQTQTKGVGFYGIPAKDNGEVNFRKIDESLNGFFATRCYIQLTSATASQLKVRHLAAGEVNSIQQVLTNDELVDVYNLAGKKIAAGLNAEKVSQLKQGIYVVKGQKVLVK
jgi:hypothetical protein